MTETVERPVISSDRVEAAIQLYGSTGKAEDVFRWLNDNFERIARELSSAMDISGVAAICAIAAYTENIIQYNVRQAKVTEESPK